MTKQERIEIFYQTVKDCQNGFYNIEEHDSNININCFDDAMIEGTKFYDQKVEINDFDNITRYETEIDVVNNDTLYEAKTLIDEGYKPLVLNMASEIIPGGGTLKGSSAQEENIFRRTNIYKSLYRYHDVGKQFNVEKNQNNTYPLNNEYGAIYTPYVTVFREGEDKNYQYTEKPYQLAVITIPSVRYPKLTQDKQYYADKQTEEKVIQKIKQLLNIAIENKHNALVLSAFGCGAFKNPPKEVARIFADVLTEEQYEGAFKKIHFAILENKDTQGEHNKQGNLKPFLEIFK